MGSRQAQTAVVQLRIRGEAEELANKISKLPGIQDVKIQSEGLLEFQFAPGKDLRPEVARLTIKADYDLLEMRPINLSLEEIFLELTREDVPAEAE